MKLYTIGFTKKTAREFFDALKHNKIDIVIDIRLNNKSQLAGFAKGNDLDYFLNVICKIKYDYEERFAPTKELLDNWKKGIISWNEYEIIYVELLKQRQAENIFVKKYSVADNSRICLLCSEAVPNYCHRRLLAEYLVDISDIRMNLDKEIVHL